jgi:hypothetical protein
MSKMQLDLELDATGVDEQLSKLAVLANELTCRWIGSVDVRTTRPALSITDDAVIALLRQAAAVQRLLDILNDRKH